MGLPAGLGNTGNHAGIGQLAESDTGKMETTQESVTTTGEFAAVHQTHGGCVTRKHRKTDVVAFSLQLGAEVCITSRDSCLFLVSFNPAFLCHNFVGVVFTLSRDKSQAEFGTQVFFFSIGGQNWGNSAKYGTKGRGVSSILRRGSSPGKTTKSIAI